MKADEKLHKQRLAELGCMACKRLHGITGGPVQLHHRRSGGWGKGDFTTLIPLCYRHHLGSDGVHGLGTKGFVARYGFTQQDLLDDAIGLLGKLYGFSPSASSASPMPARRSPYR